MIRRSPLDRFLLAIAEDCHRTRVQLAGELDVDQGRLSALIAEARLGALAQRQGTSGYWDLLAAGERRVARLQGEAAVTLHCPRCGRRFAPRKVGRPRSFCSDACKAAAYRRRRRERWLAGHNYAPGTVWTCRNCGAVCTNGRQLRGAPRGCPFCWAALEEQGRLFVATSTPSRKAVAC